MLAAAASLVAVAGWRPLALITVAFFFLIHSVTGNTAYLRSDSMALCFSVWAVVLASRARSSRAIFVVGALCASAVAAKQSFVSATVACGIHVLMTAPRRTVAFIAGGAVVTIVLACVATAYWGTDFWFAVTIPMTDYPRSMIGFFEHWGMMFMQPLFLFLVATALPLTVAALAHGHIAGWASPFLPYALVSWTVQTWVMTGVGGRESQPHRARAGNVVVDRRCRPRVRGRPSCRPDTNGRPCRPAHLPRARAPKSGRIDVLLHESAPDPRSTSVRAATSRRRCVRWAWIMAVC